ncbi:MAG TPA: ABC transporter permease [Pyrinomonadaceae bacterium]|nr:ABC transporter permease [Pyrinomonadaceae bacterium]
MLKLIIRKLLQGIIMLFAVSAIAFALLSTAGGDALSALRENPQVSEETVERLRKVYELDKPLTSRYFSWLSTTVRGDMGESIAFKTDVAALVFTRLWQTVKLGVLALLTALLVSLGLAFASARIRSRLLERIVDAVVLVSASTPRIVLALFALALTVWLSGSAVAIQGGSISAMFLAAFVLAFPLIALFLAQADGELRRAMNEPYIQFARAKGLDENTVILKHASRAALNPLLTIFGLSLGALVGGSVIVETILGWPGIGALTVAAVRNRDVPLVMGIVLISSAAVWAGNTIAEVLQMVNDKRIRDLETDRL